jgi:hypothetical protein
VNCGVGLGDGNSEPHWGSSLGDCSRDYLRDCLEDCFGGCFGDYLPDYSAGCSGGCLLSCPEGYPGRCGPGRPPRCSPRSLGGCPLNCPVNSGPSCSPSCSVSCLHGCLWKGVSLAATAKGPGHELARLGTRSETQGEFRSCPAPGRYPAFVTPCAERPAAAGCRGV